MTAVPLASLAEVEAGEWNALEAGGVPFLRHEFLAALEASGAVGAATGW
ncbi:MAG: N-acetyltransferase, partial [Proteobacteria bacterium]|nr:N-acetyltransferase [Pseudomonadota bacterium]